MGKKRTRKSPIEISPRELAGTDSQSLPESMETLPPCYQPPRRARQVINSALESELHGEAIIPWQEFYQIGNGIDALTGEQKSKAITDSNGLEPLTPNQRWKQTICRARQNIEEIFNDASIESAISINFPSNLGIGAGIKNLWSKNMSSAGSSILVEYRVEGRFEAQLLDPMPEIKLAARKVSEDVFREQYGDYFIAGWTRFFSYRAFALCENLNSSESKNFKAEAVALVQNFFKVKGTVDVSRTRSSVCSIKEMYCEHYGYDVDETSTTQQTTPLDSEVDLERMQSALNALPDFKSMTHRGTLRGTPQEAILKHYSWCAPHGISRIIAVPAETFSNLQQMRKNCGYLDMALEHPALTHYSEVRKEVNEGIQYFLGNRKLLLKDDSSHARAAKQLLDSKCRVESTISRYEFMKAFKRRKKLVSPPISESRKKSTRTEWKSCCCDFEEAGDQTGTPNGCTRVEIEWNGYKITGYQTEWNQKVTGNVLGMQMSHEYNFARIKLNKSEKGERANAPGSSNDTSKDDLPNSWNHSLIMNRQIYIIGWSIECSSSTPTKPSIKEIYNVENGIMGEELRIKIGAAPGSRFRSSIVFVLQKDFNFPDLSLSS